jgi:hypothetical protein
VQGGAKNVQIMLTRDGSVVDFHPAPLISLPTPQWKASSACP